MSGVAKFVCMCGVVHALPRARVHDGLSVAHWRCGAVHL